MRKQPAKPKGAVAAEIENAGPTWLIAAKAADSKKATGLRILDLRPVTSFADYFLIATGSNTRQTQAIWDEVVLQMKQLGGERAISVEGYENGEWILGDFGDLIVHVFTEEKREFYNLERLWRDAIDVPIPPEAAA